jgi:hypothetical protein
MELKGSMIKITAFFAELKRQTSDRIDLIIGTDTDRLFVTTDGKKVYANITFPNGEKKQYEMTTYAMVKFASLYGVWGPYVRKMLHRDRLQLFCDNVNEWIKEDTMKNRRLVRIVGDKVISMHLGPDYLCINNDKIVDKIEEKLEENYEQTGISYDVKDAKITDSHLYIKITSNALKSEVMRHTNENRKVGDVVEGGWILQNSEVGDGSFYFYQYLNVLKCTNGMVRTIGGLGVKRIHRGKEQKLGFYNYNINAKSVQELLLLLGDAVNKMFKPELFREWVNQINSTSDIPLPEPAIAVENFLTDNNFRDSLKDIILAQLEKENANNLWGLAMAVTRIAHDTNVVKDYEEQIAMERASSKILENGFNVVTLTTPRNKEVKKEE